MTVEFNGLFARAILAYRAGKSLPSKMTPAAAGELFAGLAQQCIERRLTSDEHRHYVAVRDCSREAVKASRSDSDAAARNLLQQAEQLVVQHATRDEVALLGRSWIEQAAAYVEVRCKNWSIARQRLDTAMHHDTVLEEQYDYSIFHIGRVHLMHLRLRVDAAAGNMAAAIDAVNEVAEYVLGRLDSLSWGQGWSRRRILDVDERLRNAMLARISSEAGALLTQASPPMSLDLFARFPVWRNLEGHVLQNEITGWGEAKRAYIAGNTAEFLERCAEFLRAGRRETTLWYCAALDLGRCCQAMRRQATEPFVVEMGHDARQWQRLPSAQMPPSLRAALASVGSPVQSLPHFYVHHAPPRRFQAFSVGLPRTGTSSLCQLLAWYRSANEFMETDTVSKIIARHQGRIADDDFHEFILRRVDESGLEMDSASFNHFYLDILADEFPDAKFVFTIREPRGWMNSYCKLLLRWHRQFADRNEPPARWMSDYGSLLFGSFSWDDFASPETVRRKLPELVDRFTRHWGQANRRVLQLLPPGRSLLVLTRELSHRVGEIADFLGIARETLTDRHHVNVSPDDEDLLKDYSAAQFDEACARHAADIVAHVALAAK